MPHDQRTPNGANTTASPQGDGDNRSVKEASPQTQKGLDADATEPRELPHNGHAGEDPQQEPSG